MKENARKMEDNTMTLLHTYTYKKTNIFIMQMLVAYFFILIENVSLNLMSTI